MNKTTKPVKKKGIAVEQYRKIEVLWHDAWFDFDQPTEEDARADYIVKTSGYLIKEGPLFLSLAGEVLPDGDGFRAITHIPLSIVEKVYDLERVIEKDV